MHIQIGEVATVVTTPPGPWNRNLPGYSPWMLKTGAGFSPKDAEIKGGAKALWGQDPMPPQKHAMEIRL
jgi:hypothetical protein